MINKESNQANPSRPSRPFSFFSYFLGCILDIKVLFQAIGRAPSHQWPIRSITAAWVCVCVCVCGRRGWVCVALLLLPRGCHGDRKRRLTSLSNWAAGGASTVLNPPTPPTLMTYYRVLPNIYQFYQELSSIIEFYLVLPSFTEFYRVLQNFPRTIGAFAEFHRLFFGSTGYDSVLEQNVGMTFTSPTGFYWVFPS